MRIVVTITLGIMLVAAQSLAAEPPREVRLDTLSELFAGVRFDHAMHVDAAGNCGSCHHHTTGDAAEPQCGGCHQGHKTAEVACRACHPAQPFSATYLRDKEQDRGRYHTDKPGLKAAYHRNCLGCHEQAGGPVGCQDCHPRTKSGDDFFHAGVQAAAASPGQGHAH